MLRNLVYMVQKRERLKKQLVVKEEEIVRAQLKAVDDSLQKQNNHKSNNRTVSNKGVVSNGPLPLLVSHEGLEPVLQVPVADHRVTRQMLKHSSAGGTKVLPNDSAGNCHPTKLNSKLELNQTRLNSKLELNQAKSNSKFDLNQLPVISPSHFPTLRGRPFNSDSASRMAHHHL